MSRDTVASVIVSGTTAAATLAFRRIASIYTDIYGLITNIHATTATEVLISDGTKTYSRRPRVRPGGSVRSGGLKATAAGVLWTVNRDQCGYVKVTALFNKCI